MDNKQIKDLMAAMGRWNIQKVGFKTKDGEEILLERTSDEVAYERQHIPQVKKEPIHHPPQSLSHPHQKVEPAQEESAEDFTIAGEDIKSPMVGTYFAAASPDDPPFVKEGDRVDAETVVCIIEAMKVMNEVKAGISGVIRAVYLESGQPVEYGTKLFRVE